MAQAGEGVKMREQQLGQGTMSVQSEFAESLKVALQIAMRKKIAETVE